MIGLDHHCIELIALERVVHHKTKDTMLIRRGQSDLNLRHRRFKESKIFGSAVIDHPKFCHDELH